MAEAPAKFDPKQQVHGDPLELPALCPGAMQASKPYPAAPNHNTALGFPDELVPDWKEKAIARLRELLKSNRALRVYLDSCVKCGA